MNKYVTNINNMGTTHISQVKLRYFLSKEYTYRSLCAIHKKTLRELMMGT